MLRRRAFLALLSATTAVLLLQVTAALARTQAGDKEFLAGLVRTHIQPRIDALATSTGDLTERLDRFCANPDAAGFDAAKTGYNAAMDAWAATQHLRPGPLLLELRSDRIAFWPERRNIVNRQLSQLLASRDPKLLEPGALAHQSAAVQGLTALERLLFDKGVTAASFGGDDTGRHRCAVAAAIGHNLATLGTEVRDGWAELGPKLAAGEATPVGPTATAAVDNIYASLVTMIQIVVDQKILFPLGPNPEEAKPTLAESVLAGRSLRNVSINLAALRAILTGEAGGPGYTSLLPDNPAGAAAKAETAKSFDTALAAADAVPVPLAQAVADPKQRPKVEALFRTAKVAQTTMTRTLPPLISVALGFNELDGD